MWMENVQVKLLWFYLSVWAADAQHIKKVLGVKTLAKKSYISTKFPLTVTSQ